MSLPPEPSREVPMERPMELMREAKTIAVVGVTTKKVRPANEIAEYLINAGFDVYLVNETEAGEQMLGKTIQPSVESLGVPVDIVDILLRPADVPPHVEDAIASGAKVVWMQVGIVNEDAHDSMSDAAATRAIVASSPALLDLEKQIAAKKNEQDRLEAEGISLEDKIAAAPKDEDLPKQSKMLEKRRALCEAELAALIGRHQLEAAKALKKPELPKYEEKVKDLDEKVSERRQALAEGEK